MQQRRVLQRRRGGAHGTSALLLVAALAACNGKIGANGGSGQVSVGATVYGPTGLHRLSRIEYDNTLADLLGDTFTLRVRVVARGRQRSFRQRLLHAGRFGRADRVSRDAGGRGRGAPRSPTPTKRNALVGCTPSGAGDQACLESFVRAFGRRAFRRPLTDGRGERLPRAVGVRRRDQRLLRRRRAGAAGDAAGPELPLPRRGRRRRSPGKNGLLRSTTTRSAPACRTSSGARRRRDRAAGHGGGGRAVDRSEGAARPRPSCSPIRAAPSGVKQFHAFWLGLRPAAADGRHGVGDAPPRPTPWSRAWCSSGTATTSICSTRRRRSSTTRSPAHYGLPAAREHDGRLGLLRLEPAPRHPVARHAAGRGREVRRHQPHAARRLRAQPAALPDHRRRHRPPSRSTSRPPATTQPRARSTATPPTAAAAAPTATTRPIRSASAWRITTAPAPTGRPTRTTRSAPSAGDGEVVGRGQRSTARPSWRDADGRQRRARELRRHAALSHGARAARERADGQPVAGDADRRLQAGRAHVRRAADRRRRRPGVRPPPGGARRRGHGATTHASDARCCGARAAPRSRCRRWRSCSTGTARPTRSRRRSRSATSSASAASRWAATAIRCTTTTCRTRVGANYDLKSALAPLAPVKADVSVVSGLSHPHRERRHGPGGGTARRLPRLVAEPAAVGRALAVQHGVGGPDVGSARRRRDRRQHAVQVARLPRAGRVVPGRVGALWPRHRSRTRRTRRAASPLAIPPVVSPQDGVRRPVHQLHAAERRRGRARSQDFAAAQPQERARSRRRQPAEADRQSQARARPTSSGCRATSTRSAISNGRSPRCRPSPRRPARSRPTPAPIRRSGGNQGVDAGGENTYATNLGYSGEEERAQGLLRPGPHGVHLRPDARRLAACSRCSSRT